MSKLRRLAAIVLATAVGMSIGAAWSWSGSPDMAGTCTQTDQRLCVTRPGDGQDDTGMTSYRDQYGQRWYRDDDDMATVAGWR